MLHSSNVQECSEGIWWYKLYVFWIFLNINFPVLIERCRYTFSSFLIDWGLLILQCYCPYVFSIPTAEVYFTTMHCGNMDTIRCTVGQNLEKLAKIWKYYSNCTKRRSQVCFSMNFDFWENSILSKRIYINIYSFYRYKNMPQERSFRVEKFFSHQIDFSI